MEMRVPARRWARLPSRRATLPAMAFDGDVQLTLPITPLRGVAELPPETVERESGSRPPIYLQCADMSSYYCKGPHLMSGHPYMGANEWITGSLARLLGLPSRKVEIISWHGELYAGIEILANDRRLTGPLTAEKWARVKNADDVVYPLVALDFWTINQDRHDFNCLIGVVSDGVGWFLANDHDMAILPAGLTPAELKARVALPVDETMVRSDVIRNSVRDPIALRGALDAVERVSDLEIAGVISHLPAEWIDEDGRRDVIAFLCDRRDVLGGLVAANLDLFANLERL
jgi:hypothetical protein